MYLSDVEEGGETVFPFGTPLGEDKSTQSEEEREANACAGAAKGSPDVLMVKPRRGDAVLFYNAHLNGVADEKSAHAGCPVMRGTKWTATQWMRVGAVGIGTFAKTQ
jgi:prolyl 4-hydroxylase